MASFNIDPRWPTPYISETDYSLNGWPRPQNKLTPFRPDPVTMYRSYAESVRLQPESSGPHGQE